MALPKPWESGATSIARWSPQQLSVSYKMVDAIFATLKNFLTINEFFSTKLNKRGNYLNNPDPVLKIFSTSERPNVVLKTVLMNIGDQL